MPPESLKPDKPSRRRMAAHAIAVLEDAERAAQGAPVALTPAYRLAIGWLVLDGLANRMQAERFTRALTTPPNPSHGPQAEYMRTTEMDQMLEAWRREVRKRDREFISEAQRGVR